MIPGKRGSLMAGALAAGAMWLLAAPVAGAVPMPSRDAVPSVADPLAPAMDDFYNLEYDAAEKELEARLNGHPDDLRALCYLARVYLQREMLRRELLEAQAYGNNGAALRHETASVNVPLRRKLFGLLDRLQGAAQQRLKLNPRDEDALYWLGASHVTRAIYFLSIEKSNMQALNEAKEAQKDHARLLQLDPNCADAYLVVGTYDYIVGSLPWYMKVLTALMGYHGDRQRGLAELERAAEHGHWARTDAQIFLSILYFREKRYADAIRILKKLEQDYPRNFLLPQEIARADKAQGDWHSAAREYDAMLQKYESHAPGFERLPAAKVYYQAGQVDAQLGEKDIALRRFQEAASLQEDNIYVYRAELAAARIEMNENRSDEARVRFERVARAVPNSDEGHAAAAALENFPSASHAGGENPR